VAPTIWSLSGRTDRTSVLVLNLAYAYLSSSVDRRTPNISLQLTPQVVFCFEGVSLLGFASRW
jgi:hypothetical protein